MDGTRPQTLLDRPDIVASGLFTIPDFLLAQLKGYFRFWWKSRSSDLATSHLNVSTRTDDFFFIISCKLFTRSNFVCIRSPDLLGVVFLFWYWVGQKMAFRKWIRQHWKEIITTVMNICNVNDNIHFFVGIGPLFLTRWERDRFQIEISLDKHVNQRTSFLVTVNVSPASAWCTDRLDAMEKNRLYWNE